MSLAYPALERTRSAPLSTIIGPNGETTKVAKTKIITEFARMWPRVFVVPESKHVDQVEGVLITTMPTANRATPKIRRIHFPAKAWKTAKKAERDGSLL